MVDKPEDNSFQKSLRHEHCFCTHIVEHFKRIIMGETKDLSGKEAVEKLQELVKAADICLFTTNLTQLPLSTRPMSTQDVDDNGYLWFLSGKSSHKNEDITADNRVQLFYYNKSSAEYLSVYGEAEKFDDRKL